MEIPQGEPITIEIPAYEISDEEAELLQALLRVHPALGEYSVIVPESWETQAHTLSLDSRDVSPGVDELKSHFEGIEVVSNSDSKCGFDAPWVSLPEGRTFWVYRSDEFPLLPVLTDPEITTILAYG